MQVDFGEGMFIMKKILAIFMVFCMLIPFAVLSLSAVSAEDSNKDIWDGTVGDSFASGTGVESDPYIIETASQFAYLSTVYVSDKYVKLVNDIYLNNTEGWEDWENTPPENEWTPISSDCYFDGDNHTVYGLYSSGEATAGLFASVSEISNITLKESYIYATSSAAGIAVSANSTTNCHNYATVKSEGGAAGISISGWIANCHNYGTVEAKGSASGIGGYGNNDVYCCSNHGNISGKTAGGISANVSVSSSSYNITKCYNTGKITGTSYAGGIVGYVSRAYSYEYIENSSNNTYNYYYCYYNSLNVVNNSYNCGTVSGACAGGIAGSIKAVTIVGKSDTTYYKYKYYYNTGTHEENIHHCYNAGVVNGSDYSGQIVGELGEFVINYTTASTSDLVYYTYYYNPKATLQNGIGNHTSDTTSTKALSKANAMMLTSYTAFSSDVWVMSNNPNYPYPELNANPQPHEHFYTEVTDKEATCTEDGLKTFTCWCSYTYDEVIKASGHKYEETVVSATCTNDGLKTYTCSCGDSYTETISASGHDIVNIKVEVTCTEDGETYSQCSVCETIIGEKEIIPATGHKYEETINKEATCTEDGLKTFTCSCSDTYDEVIEASGHKYEETVVSETCTKAGLRTYTCSCGDSYTETIPASGHDIVTVTVEATCTEDGETYSQCSVCETVIGEKEVIPATGHRYKETVTTKATCTTAGLKTFTCTCSDTYTETIPATGHDLKLVSQANTCTSVGFEYYICNNCGNMIGDTEYLPKLGHSYKKTIKTEATCVTSGEALYDCIRCEDYYTEEIPSTGHSFGEWVQTKTPTCTETGSKRRDCTNCDEYETETVAKTEHNWNESFTVDKQPSCMETGSKSIHCADCNATKDETQMAPTGHSFGEWNLTTEPTCTKAGVESRVCHNCEEQENRSVKAKGHDESDWIVTVVPTQKTDGQRIKECTRCKIILVEETLPKTLTPDDKVHSVSIDDISMNYKDSATVTPEIDVADGISYTVKYTSSDNNVVTVDANGKITTVGRGEATITCTVTDEFSNVVTDTCTVKVNYTFLQWLLVIFLFGWIWY